MRSIFIASLVGFLFSCSGSRNMPAANSITGSQASEGWKLLFDGKTTKGWHTYGGQPIGSAWKVRDGYLYLDTTEKENGKIKGGGDIVTDEEYGDFELLLEWKIAKDGNSGIIIYVHEDKTTYEWPWQSGPEMQILDNAGHPDAKFIKHRAGDLYDMIASSPETVKPYGEWNYVRILSLKGQLDFYLNEVKVLSTTMWNDSWKQLISQSKFKNAEGFGTYKTGRLGLQDHGDEVCFRNMKIRRL